MGMNPKDANAFDKMKANLEAQALANNPDAMHKLGLIAEKANLHDRTQAYAYQKIAYNNGYQGAQGALQRLEKDLSADQLRQANEMAFDWIKNGRSLPRFTPQYGG
jgi:hypothetical protein